MTLLPLLGAGALLLAPATALAQRTAPVSVTVAHADLDLSTARGLATLDRRIARAAHTACGDASQSDLAGTIASRRCRDEARASASAQRDHVTAGARPVEVAARR